MLTDRFHKLRKAEIDKIFSKEVLARVWRKVVRNQLRTTDILDIYDYYDFNYDIESRATIIRNNLFGGNYVPSKPLVYRIEKKYGICRHLVIPQPVDCLILQVITEKLRESILKHQPSPNSYYSRDRHSVKKPHEINEYGFDWRQLWKQMQKQIYKFQEEKELIVVTDLSNYYDSIFIPELRKIITRYTENNEVILDILFKIIENISWLPDYLPYTGRGLPTTNLEGVRLMAHSLLFELDAILKEKSNDSYIRWMDDIIIGVQTRKEAIETLSSASDILKSRGLALNLRKTEIYSAHEAEFHFMIEENQYLDSIDFEDHIKNGIGTISTELSISFKRHLKNNEKAKYFEKITKRYITGFTKLKSKRILNQVPKLFNENPGIRVNLLYYLAKLGYNKRTEEVTLSILDSLKLYDDISLFKICKLVTDWEIPFSTNGEKFVKIFIGKITEFGIARSNPFDFYCQIWVRAKYNHPLELLDFVFKFKSLWKMHQFLRRQITGLLGRLYLSDRTKIENLIANQISTAEPHVVSLASSIDQAKDKTVEETRINMYLFPDNKQKVYPLSKFLILCSYLNSDVYRNSENVKTKCLEIIKDPYYLRWLDVQYNIR